MKNRMLKALIGVSAVMVMASGCSSQPKEDKTAELQTLEILGIEEVSEISEKESKATSASPEETAPSELDLGVAKEEMESAAEGSTGDIVESGQEAVTETELETVAAAEKKAGKETEPELRNETTPEVKDSVEKETGVETETKNVASGVQKTGKETEKKKQTEKTEKTEKSDKSEGTEKPEQTETTRQTEKTKQTEKTPQSEKITETEDGLKTKDETETEPATEAARAATGLRVAADRVNVRKGPSTEAEKMAALDIGMKVLCLSEEKDWSKIHFESSEGIQEGYVKTEYLADIDQLYTAKEKVNVRKEATTDSDKVGALEAGEKAVVTELSNGWAKIRFSTESGVIDAYVKAEFLEKGDLDASNDSIVREAEQLTGQKVEKETETEPSEAIETEAESPEFTESTESETVPPESSEVQASTEPQAFSEDESETSVFSETESETQAVSENPSEQESENETGLELAEGAESQFQLTKLLFPETAKVGILYSGKNTSVSAQLETYGKLADTYGMELLTVSVEEEADIDFAASELVGSVDCIFCIDDSVINDLLQTVCAYADEVEIPVIGTSGEQVEKGSLIAYEGGKLHWNTEKAGKLGKNSDELRGNQLVEY